jgi:hypothetical protein
MPFSTARHAAGDTSSLVANQESVLPFFTGMDAKRAVRVKASASWLPGPMR